MISETQKIALGGGCHWCTEAVFQSLKGVVKVEQGYVASKEENASFSEAVIVHFFTKQNSLQALIEIHLHTHKSTSNHSMREKYRSAIYVFSEEQKKECQQLLSELQSDFKDKLITKVLFFNEFKPSRTQITNYYFNNPEKPFCRQFINPKLKLLLANFSEKTETAKLAHL
ncbi:peptide-methionine (S)-S-oxide reductase [Jejudonia soesokkakensis]|uniref:peptide-methionine (S)-S-oxide reductase n=1 Tax=Jejudonia soesokkakensis TaxID=1323432 RepID=A0ABW2MUK7_9FLAO